MATEVTFDKGIDLRTARHVMAPGTLLDAMNLVPDELGALTTRQGMSLVGLIANVDMTGYYKLHGNHSGQGTHTYQGFNQADGQQLIYRDFSVLLSGPSGAAGYIDFCDMREFQNDRSWVFFAAGQSGFRFKDDGAFTANWGIRAPSTPCTATLGAAGSLNGTYTYRYIYVRHDGTGLIPVNWGNPSPESASITANFQQVILTNFANPTVAGPNLDLQVTHIYIYRNVALTPGAWLLTAIINSFETQWIDGKPDADLPLPSGMPTGLLEFDNGLPPVFTSITVHQDRIWGVTGADNRVWYSKVQRPEQFSATGYLELGPLSDAVTIVKSYNGRLYAGTDSRLIPILGTDEFSYQPDNTPLPVGVVAPFSMAQGLRGLYWRGPDGIYRWNGASAENISDRALYPLFHRDTSNGVPPNAFGGHPFGPQYFSAGGWAEGRYYICMPVALNDPLATRTYVYDEMTDTWYPDSRSFRRFYYSQQDNQLIGTTSTGVAYQLNNGTYLENGVPIPWGFQSRDISDGEPQSDQSLEELTIDLAGDGSPVSLQIVKDFGASNSDVVQFAAAGRMQQVLAMAQNTIVAKALGYKLSGTGLVKLYRLMPRVLVFPPTRLAAETLPTDLGYPGPKRIVGFTMDMTLLEPGALVVNVIGDNLSHVSGPLTTVGRTQTELVQTPFEATILQTSIRSTGRWRLYPNTFVSWIPLPISRYVDITLPTDLGYAGDKRILEVWVDTELLTPGTLSAILQADAQAIALTPQTTVGRRHANILTQAVTAAVIGLTLQSTALFRQWAGTMIVWQALPTARYVDSMLPSDLGYAGPKRLVGVWLDVELLSPGTLTPTLIVDGVSIPLTPIVGQGRVNLNLLTTPVDATTVEVSISSTVPFRRWSDNFIAWIPLPPEYLSYNWPASTLGTADEKMLQAVSLDIELKGPGPAILSVEIDQGVPFEFSVSGVGRHATNRLRFPRAAHGKLLEYSISSSSYWRLWGGEFLFRKLGSTEGLQRFPMGKAPGSTGPEVQRTPFGSGGAGEVQRTPLGSGAPGGSVQRTPIAV